MIYSDILIFLIFKKHAVRRNIKMQCYYRKAPVHMIMTHASSFDRLPLEMISFGWTKGKYVDPRNDDPCVTFKLSSKIIGRENINSWTKNLH